MKLGKVDTVIPIGFASYPALTALNNAIPNWASGLSTLSSPIVVVDVSLCMAIRFLLMDANELPS